MIVASVDRTEPPTSVHAQARSLGDFHFFFSSAQISRNFDDAQKFRPPNVFPGVGRWNTCLPSFYPNAPRPPLRQIFGNPRRLPDCRTPALFVCVLPEMTWCDRALRRLKRQFCLVRPADWRAPLPHHGSAFRNLLFFFDFPLVARNPPNFHAVLRGWESCAALFGRADEQDFWKIFISTSR